MDERLQKLKRRISLAALGCLRNATDAAHLVQAALAEVDEARKVLWQAFRGVQKAQTVPEVSEATREDLLASDGSRSAEGTERRFTRSSYR